MKRKDLKKHINYLCGELLAECIAAAGYSKKDNKQDIENVMLGILKMQNDWICRLSHVEPGSTRLFFKKLKAITGRAPVELVRQIRLAKSCELIKTTTSSFTEIAQIVGFNDLGYFGKCFKKRYGMTLKEYAAKYREI